MNRKITLEKRILSVLLTVIITFSMVPMSVFAADSEPVSGGGIYVPPGGPTEGGGGTYIPDEETNTEIHCTRKPDSIGRSYNGTSDGSTIAISMYFTTDGTDEIVLTEGTDFTAVKTFDSPDAGYHTVDVSIALIGEAAKKYKLKEGEENFTIKGTIYKAYPHLSVSLSKSECTTIDKILPLLSVEGVAEDASVTYYYTPIPSSIYDSTFSSLNVEIDENTTISDIDEIGNTYYIFARSTETKNYNAVSSEAVKLTVNEAPKHTHDDFLFIPWDGTGEEPYSVSESACVYLTDNVTRDLTLSGEQQLTLCLNGKKFNGSINVKDGGKLTLCDCSGMGHINEIVADGGLFVGTGGKIDKLTINGKAYDVKLSGGEFGAISFNNSEKVTITDILEAGYAFKDNNGKLTDKAGKLIAYGFTVDPDKSISQLEVVKCDHSAVNEAKGCCNYCGMRYAGKIVNSDSSERYVETLQDSDFGNGSTVVLLKDINEIVTPVSSCTIDLNGKFVNQIDFTVQNGTLTLKGNGKISAVSLGDENIDSTLAMEQESNEKRIEIDSLSVNKTTETKLTSGQFGKIERKDGHYVRELLADGYAFFENDSGKLISLGNKTEITGNYYIDKHEHSFTTNADGKNECECGLICEHTDIGENGKCKACKSQIYFAKLIKADGTESKYEEFNDAWSAAIKNSGSTLKLLCDIEIEPIKLDTGKFTLDLGGFELSSFAYQQLLEVDGTADIFIKNGVLHNTFNTLEGGQLFLTTGNAILIKGGSVTLDSVTLQGAWEKDSTMSRGELQSYALIQHNGTLAVQDSTFIGSLTIYKSSENASPATEIKSATLNNGFNYACIGKDKSFDVLSAYLAKGSMFFNENGKYVDLSNESYWSIEGGEEIGFYANCFVYDDMAVVKPHSHDKFENGKCSECDFACPHDSGKNDREASYFEKGICSICHCEYGDYAEDTIAPTGTIKIKERTWWQDILHVISFGLLFDEEVTGENNRR